MCKINKESWGTVFKAFGLSMLCLAFYHMILNILLVLGLLDPITLMFNINFPMTYPWLLQSIQSIVLEFNTILHFKLGFFIPHDSLIHPIILAPIFEEIQFRLPLLFIKNKRIRLACAIISTFIFAICHPLPLIQTIGIFIVGSLLAYTALKTKSIKYSMILHAIYNFTVSFG